MSRRPGEAEQRAHRRQEARRERAEAQLHEERASLHEQGLADHELVEDHERARFAGTPAARDDDTAYLGDDARDRNDLTDRDGVANRDERGTVSGTRSPHRS